MSYDESKFEGEEAMNLNSLGASSSQYNSTRYVSDLGRSEDRGRGELFPHKFVAQANTNFDSCIEEQLAERIRVARELHDTLFHGFFAASMQLQSAMDALPADSEAKHRFSGILSTIDQVLEEGRRALRGLRSAGEQIESLGESFARVWSDLGTPSTVGFRVFVSGRERKLKAEWANEVFHIGREAIVNAFRHSRATHIEAELEYRSTELRIIVRDDGCGINPEELQASRLGNWGLQGMRERAERIGARLRVWGGVALGTEVELCVPGQVAFEPSEAAIRRGLRLVKRH